MERSGRACSVCHQGDHHSEHHHLAATDWSSQSGALRVAPPASRGAAAKSPPARPPKPAKSASPCKFEEMCRRYLQGGAAALDFLHAELAKAGVKGEAPTAAAAGSSAILWERGGAPSSAAATRRCLECVQPREEHSDKRWQDSYPMPGSVQNPPQEFLRYLAGRDNLTRVREGAARGEETSEQLWNCPLAPNSQALHS